MAISYPNRWRSPRAAERPLDILVVEDDQELRDSIIDLLEMEGLQTRSAGNGFEALSQLRNGYRPDLILMDLMMPVMTGWELREEMSKRPEWANIPVIVMTAMDEHGTGFPDPEADSMLKKPFGFSRLLELVSHARSLV